MVRFNECRVTEDGDRLVIKASVDSLKYYDNVYIDSIIIDTDKTYTPNGPSSNPVYVRKFVNDGDDSIHDGYSMETKGQKKISISICGKDMDRASLNDDIFFVYASTSGIPSPDTPCGMDNFYTMAAAVNMRPIYNEAMKYIRELNNSCEIPKGFIDAILKLKGFDLSLKTGHISTAIDMWSRLLKNRTATPDSKCKCNGKYL